MHVDCGNDGNSFDSLDINGGAAAYRGGNGDKNTHVIYWLICVICLKAFLLNPTPEIELNFGLVPIIIGPAVLLPQRAPQTGSFRLLLYSELSIC